MNFVQELILNLQELATQVPALVKPLIVALAAAIPMVEGEVGAVIGMIGGMHPLAAATAAVAGNFLTVLIIVLLTSRARTAVVSRSRARVGASVGASSLAGLEDVGDAAVIEPAASAKPESKGRQRVKTWLVRFGVPGASILGPLAIPTQFTSAMLVAAGTSRAWVLLWQAVAIVLWTTVTTVGFWLALTYVVGV
ncbi:small multidrug efflux protein [Microbacterium sp. zg.Y1090]|uniref:small multidrug efflux protein n=1 Tax=Microbacterium TaxID=33882 RepID=UPI00214B8AB2|nr:MULTISPECIES: small multidrug efflux protein [unclassified Microbacterium]MCR2812909.1 small multidrug efflux protein [Microbacterium sp. zg.Y1084]MCR2817282.1 small multidrug efflux protein [Microbacterium sp. zg.Y1090]MDL5486052.1 small multidrug efflux protein [Microbacterium sp. zg-Y1211]WIM29229.1 small multidrug efflux protein [Microbacterium sp. zg-Y1090]